MALSTRPRAQTVVVNSSSSSMTPSFQALSMADNSTNSVSAGFANTTSVVKAKLVARIAPAAPLPEFTLGPAFFSGAQEAAGEEKGSKETGLLARAASAPPSLSFLSSQPAASNDSRREPLALSFLQGGREKWEQKAAMSAPVSIAGLSSSSFKPSV